MEPGVGGKVGAHCLAFWSLQLTREGRPELGAQRQDIEKGAGAMQGTRGLYTCLS